MKITLRKVSDFILDKNKRTIMLSARGLCKFMPDEEYLKREYKGVLGKDLDLNNPITFNEKLQWLKLYDRKPLYSIMVDKYEAKKYVASIIGDEYIIPNIGVWDRFEDIDFDLLPSQFVLKCTHDSGGLIICRDKAKFDVQSARKKINKHLKREYFFEHREWPYQNVKPRIIAEKYMEQHYDNEGNAERGSLIDYKFYCFNGEPKFLYVSAGLENHETACISFLNLDWSKTEFKRSDYKEFDQLPPKPIHLNEMIKIAKTISTNIPFARIDLYEINEVIYFSEITFSPCAGMTLFSPEDWDYKLGEKIILPMKN